MSFRQIASLLTSSPPLLAAGTSLDRITSLTLAFLLWWGDWPCPKSHGCCHRWHANLPDPSSYYCFATRCGDGCLTRKPAQSPATSRRSNSQAGAEADEKQGSCPGVSQEEERICQMSWKSCGCAWKSKQDPHWGTQGPQRPLLP